MMKDVDRVIVEHEAVQQGRQGNMNLGYLTRAGVLFLCAGWELYNEELVLEAVQKILDRVTGPDRLPTKVQKVISNYVREAKHELKPLALAGDGWRTVYQDKANEVVATLNTPKKGVIDNLFHTLIGFEDVSEKWSCGSKAINDFVSVRGDVAHKGADAATIHIRTLRDVFKPRITQTVLEMDHAISTFIRDAYPDDGYPWRRRPIA